jgi:hypothetical protein
MIMLPLAIGISLAKSPAYGRSIWLAAGERYGFENTDAAPCDLI